MEVEITYHRSPEFAGQNCGSRRWSQLSTTEAARWSKYNIYPNSRLVAEAAVSRTRVHRPAKESLAHSTSGMTARVLGHHGYHIRVPRTTKEKREKKMVATGSSARIRVGVQNAQAAGFTARDRTRFTRLALFAADPCISKKQRSCRKRTLAYAPSLAASGSWRFKWALRMEGRWVHGVRGQRDRLRWAQRAAGGSGWAAAGITVTAGVNTVRRLAAGREGREGWYWPRSETASDSNGGTGSLDSLGEDWRRRGSS
ncbi:hypothetical protein C8F04DRAFT_1246906 [Mycena alexandri]|uniref:Uncharacterized protein n=1 Tax=Mycena alexandri TaxID=1745969 RepID=A0AAD6RVJ0_9AGAR|nr:hypothetical protein C8F04DRAFT_1246906 [Mycena alexandri]